MVQGPSHSRSLPPFLKVQADISALSLYVLGLRRERQVVIKPDPGNSCWHWDCVPGASRALSEEVLTESYTDSMIPPYGQESTVL